MERRLTGQDEENDPVKQQHRPEDRNIKDLPPAAEERDEHSPGGPIPELELWEAANEGLELLVGLGRKSSDGAVLHLVVEFIARGIELWLEESQEQVEEVDTEGISH